MTREEFKTGNATAKVQQIDNAFFNMLSLHHQIVNNITVTNLNKTYTGREAIRTFKNIFKDQLALSLFLLKYPKKSKIDWENNDRNRNEFLSVIFDNYDTINQEILNEVYKDFHDQYGNSIGHYMRNNYRIVKFIVNNVADDEYEQEEVKKETGREPIIGDKRYYFGMLRAQWSNAEFELIFINSLYTENIKFKSLILKYDVLDIQATSNAPLEIFKLKENMSRFKAYRNLIEIKN